MKAIWKTVLEITHTQVIKVPKGSNFISVALQFDKLVVWYIVDDRAEIEKVNIYIFGTGNPIPNTFDGEFIGTVLMFNDALGWHVFREI